MQANSKAGIKHRLQISNRMDSSRTIGCDECGTSILSIKGHITNLPATVSTVQHCHLLEKRAKLSVAGLSCAPVLPPTWGWSSIPSLWHPKWLGNHQWSDSIRFDPTLVRTVFWFSSLPLPANSNTDTYKKAGKNAKSTQQINKFQSILLRVKQMFG